MRKAPKIAARQLLKWVNKFDGVPMAVIGDIMLDRSIRGPVERISPEAPVPVVDVCDQTQMPGGAGNVACNLAALGAHPSIISVRGDDFPGEQILSELRARSVDVSSILVDRDRPTITKTRVIAGHQQVVRFDIERRKGLSKEMLDRLLGVLRQTLSKNKGVIISDYGKGVVTPPLIQSALKEAHRHGAFVTVDPKIEHFMQYKGVDCITPNTKEAIEGMRSLPPRTEGDLVILGWKILKKLRCQSLLITRGEKGMALFHKEGWLRLIPAYAREVFDVTGAGDTVVATFALARAVGAPHEDAAQIANLAASLVVAKVGTAVVTKEELIGHIKNFS